VARLESLTHRAEEELGQSWRIRLEDYCQQRNLRGFSLPASDSEKTKELALLGRVVRELREERHVSQVELAATAGVERRRLDALESGRLDPDYVLLVRLAKALGVEAGALVVRAEGLANEAGEPGDAVP
jgi:DNA-binding XRE family transcriptional regulator